MSTKNQPLAIFKCLIRKFKAMKAIVILFLALIATNCRNDSFDAQPCYEGIIIGKIRTSGGGVAVSMQTSALSTHEWHGFQHVIEALNIPEDFWVPGQKIYFTARPGTEEERGYITIDGGESDKPIIFVITFSTIECPDGTEES